MFICILKEREQC